MSVAAYRTNAEEVEHLEVDWGGTLLKSRDAQPMLSCSHAHASRLVALAGPSKVCGPTRTGESSS
jgi:hypothetical protein